MSVDNKHIPAELSHLDLYFQWSSKKENVTSSQLIGKSLCE